MIQKVQTGNSGSLKARPLVIGHRGTAGTVPENTLESFRQAVKDGADALEADVHLSADGEVVVCHDASVDRTTDGTGAVAGMTLAQLKALDAGYRFTADGGTSIPFRGKGLRIPTLEELLSAVPNTPLNIELKVANAQLLEKCVALLRKHKRLADVTLLVYKLDRKLVKRLRLLTPAPLTGYTGYEVARFVLLSRLRLTFLFKAKSRVMQLPPRRGRVKLLTPAFVRAAHQKGIAVHVWTIDQEPELRRCLALGVDAIFTNYPGRMRKLVDTVC